VCEWGVVGEHTVISVTRLRMSGAVKRKYTQLKATAVSVMRVV
jgi:hypothetical protein